MIAALIEEDPQDGVVGRAHRLEDGDLLLLVEHDHDQRRDDGEGRDDDDEREHRAHPDLLDAERGEEAVVQLLPVHRVVEAVREHARRSASEIAGALSMSSTFISTPVTVSP